MSDDEKASEPDQAIVVKYGFPLRVVQFGAIKTITSLATLLLIVDVFISCKLFVSAVKIRTHLGYFIDMVSSGDGDTLPTLQAIPVLLFLILDVMMAYFIFKIFDPTERPDVNRIMFVVALLGFVLLIAILIIIICVIAHAYSKHETLHDGIVSAMASYYNSSTAKAQMDHLQIEFQCCGSKAYDEWYTVKWMDQSLEQGAGSDADGHTPFSCCSMKSLSPCVHHNIEVTGKAYSYTPEFNLSISTRGCYEMIREKKQEIGWKIVANLALFFLLEALTVSLFRFLQTGHFVRSRFHGHSRSYTIWVFGRYVGKVKTETPEVEKNPEPPPVPPELKESPK